MNRKTKLKQLLIEAQLADTSSNEQVEVDTKDSIDDSTVKSVIKTMLDQEAENFLKTIEEIFNEVENA